MLLRFALAAVLVGAPSAAAQFPGVGGPSAATPFPGVGTIYTLTNDAADNEVQVGVHVFGELQPMGSYSTGGTGTGAGLGSQGALAMSQDGRHLVVVNPGSDDVTLFRSAGPAHLQLQDVADTGGQGPTSVAIHRDLVYALNADSDDVTGFRIVGSSLQPLGRFGLSGSGVAAAQVGFDPQGDHVVVTERATNQILVFPVESDGSLGTPTATVSAAPTPFGFQFGRTGTLVVSEAAGGQPGLSAVSTYRIRPDDGLEVLAGGVATNQTAACWIAIPTNGRFAYTTNTGSGTVTGYDLARDGALAILDPSGETGTLPAGGAPIDAHFDRSGRLLFVLDSANNAIVTFGRDAQGALTLLPSSLSLPAGAAGLIAR